MSKEFRSHYEMPLHLAKRIRVAGKIENCMDFYERFAQSTVQRDTSSKSQSYWMTFNEVNSDFHFPALSQDQ